MAADHQPSTSRRDYSREGEAPLVEDQADRGCERGRQTTEKGKSGEGARNESGCGYQRHAPGPSRNDRQPGRIASRSPICTAAAASTSERSTELRRAS